MTKAFDKIAEGLNEVLAIARGEAAPAKIHFPQQIDVRAIRAELGLSQGDFASVYGFTINQIRDWEQGRSQPAGGVRAYLTVIERAPKIIASLLPRASSGRLPVGRLAANRRRQRATPRATA